MATALDIISRALRLCRVLDAAGAVPADDAQDALLTLNGMLAEWHEAQIGLPDYSFATLSTELASDAADREAIAYQLAVRLAPEYDAELSALALGVGEQTMNRLRLRYFQPGNVDFTELPARTYTFNIETGDL